MSSLLAWCSEERAADSNVGTAAADTEFSLETMMAAVGLEFGKPVVVRTDHPVPSNFIKPGPNEVVVAVAFVAINPIDYKLLDGHFGGKVPSIPCTDFSGRVLRVGPGVSKVAAGDYVAGFGSACAAHMCVVADSNVVKLSSSKNLKTACAAGVVTLTASECMRKGEVTAGCTVVVVGASGGVGHVVVQMAKHLGACVIGICSTSNGQFVKDLGADIILLYDAGPNFDFADALNGRPIDVVIDCVGGDHYFQSACRCAYPLGASRGRFVTIVGPEPDAAKVSYVSALFKFATRAVAQLWQPSYSFVLGFPHLAQDLAANVPLIDSGKLKIQIHKEFALSDINSAIQEQKTHRSVGKIILAVQQM